VTYLYIGDIIEKKRLNFISKILDYKYGAAAYSNRVCKGCSARGPIAVGEKAR